LSIIAVDRTWLDLGASLRQAVYGLMGRRFWRVLALLGMIDAALILLHVLWSRNVTMTFGGDLFSFSANRWLNLGQERGYAEMKEMVCVLAAAILLTLAWMRDRQPVYLGLAGVFCLVVGDNLLQFHEKAGVSLAGFVGHSESSMVRHSGELGAFILLGLLVLVIFIAAYRRSSVQAQRHALIGLCTVSLLAAFAIGIDALHAIASATFEVPSGLDDVFTLIEDGGETVSISLALAFSVALHRLVTRRHIGLSHRPVTPCHTCCHTSGAGKNSTISMCHTCHTCHTSK
jgi:hypothetical protein